VGENSSFIVHGAINEKDNFSVMGDVPLNISLILLITGDR